MELTRIPYILPYGTRVAEILTPTYSHTLLSTNKSPRFNAHVPLRSLLCICTLLPSSLPDTHQDCSTLARRSWSKKIASSPGGSAESRLLYPPQGCQQTQALPSKTGRFPGYCSPRRWFCIPCRTQRGRVRPPTSG